MNISYFPPTPGERPTVQLRSVRDGNTRPASVAQTTVEINVNTLPENAVVKTAVVSVTTSGVGAYGSNLEVCTVNGNDVRSAAGGEASTDVFRIELYGNRTVTLSLIYQMSRYVVSSQYTVTFSDIHVRVEWEEGEDANTYTDNEVMVPVRGAWLYDADAADFSKGGIVLQPTKCVVRETAGGKYNLEMEHPFDPEGRWKELLEERQIKAGVPPFKIPEVTLPVGKYWQVKSSVTSTPLYSRLPTYERSETPVPAWKEGPEYHTGDHVWDYYPPPSGTKTIFMSGGTNQGSGSRPGSGLGTWAVVGPLRPDSVDPHGGTGNWNPGVVIRDLESEEIVTFIAVYNSKYIQVRDYLGNIGYAPSEDLEETATAADPIVIPERRIYTQIFRIKTVSCDEASHAVTVSAEHISYDLQANKLFDCQMTEAEPATAVALLQGRLMNDDSRLIACPFEYPLITADWSFQNPVQAVLDPEDGLAGKLRCMVLRDNGDFFLLPQRSRIGARLAYGVNLTGVKWSRDISELVTRLIPRAGDGEGGMLYLDELFIDSTHIDDYAVIRTEVLDSKYSVGQEIEKADGTKQTLSKSDVIERMREECENRYYVDGADKVAVSLDVSFILLGDTEEFRQYRNLERLCLYDTIAVDTGHMETRAQVIGYEWDSIAGRYDGISIGKMYAMARKKIPGYRVANGAISYGKLSAGLIKWIKGADS